MSSPLVSILIPCYNAETWLAESIESALAQTWENTEIIVVDDGSVDMSLSVAYAYKELGITVISQLNKGASAARNCALKEAKGDFIQYLDADDLLEPNKIKCQVEHLVASPKGTTATGEWARFYTSLNEARFEKQPLWNDFSPIDWLLCAWDNHWMMHPAAWLIPKATVEKTGPWDERLSLNDDGEYFSRIVLASEEIKFCKGARVYYRSGNVSSLSATSSDNAYYSAFLSWDLCTQALLASECSRRTKLTAANVFQRFIYEVYPHVPSLRAEAHKNIKLLGGSCLKPSGGPVFYAFSKLLGWELAKRIQQIFYRYGYRQIAIGWRIGRVVKKLFHSQTPDLSNQ